MELTSPKNHTFQYISGEMIYPIWEKIQAVLTLAAAHSRGEWEVEDVLIKVSLGQQQLWLFSEEEELQLIGVTEIIEFPRKKSCNIFAVAGFNMTKYWNAFSQKLFLWLDLLEVDSLETTCRDEVMEKLLPLGFIKKANVLYFPWKELS